MKHPKWFWEKVQAATDDGCWLWTGKPNSSGYGVRKSGGKTEKAHRIAWELANGAIPNGMCVCHYCDVPLCVNPAHLFLSTNEGNTADRHTKGRDARQPGEQNGSAKLTASQVSEIRTRCRAGGITHAALAAEYGVSASTICLVTKGKRWVRVSKVTP